MCFSYDLNDLAELDDLFGLTTSETLELSRAYPGRAMPVILHDNELKVMRWGLVPKWAKEPESKYHTHNARADTLVEKPLFKDPAKHRQRCLVPANAFYEWKKEGKGKELLRIHLKGVSLFTFAGLYEVWNKKLWTFTVITTEPNLYMKTIHDRMPVILNQDTHKTWLDPNIETGDVMTCLEPYQGEMLAEKTS